MQRASKRPGPCPGIIQFGRRKVAGAIKTTSDQDLAVLEQGGGVVRTGITHGTSKRPGTGTGIIQFSRYQIDASGPMTAGDQDGASGQQSGRVNSTRCAHGDSK